MRRGPATSGSLSAHSARSVGKGARSRRAHQFRFEMMVGTPSARAFARPGRTGRPTRVAPICTRLRSIVPRTKRRAPLLRRDALQSRGPSREVGPGSAAQREERCTAPWTRDPNLAPVRGAPTSCRSQGRPLWSPSFGAPRIQPISSKRVGQRPAGLGRTACEIRSG
jgi:hypothetical protein